MRLKIINPEDHFDPNKVITNPNPIEKDAYTQDGLFSELVFGKLTSDFEYSCHCGELVGKYFEGLRCNKCDTVCEKSEAVVNKSGWIDLGDGFIINFILYKMAEKIIGKTNLIKILRFNPALDAEGNTIITEDKNNPYACRGMKFFRDNFDEILDFFHKKRGGKHFDKLMFIKINRDSVFMNKIPVISTILRPAIMVKDTIKIDEMNLMYSNIMRRNKSLKAKIIGEDLEIITAQEMYDIQMYYNELCEKIVSVLKGKTGFIRGNICGSRLNFSARNILSPAGPHIKIDECSMPYLTFHELYKYEIINYIKFIKNISYIRAEKIWSKTKLAVDPEVFSIMNKMIRDNRVGILFNRNPTISYGSILYLRIAEIKKDYEDKTISINNCILDPLSADYDGDVLNIISIKDSMLGKSFREVYSPENMMIDGDTGMFNEAFALQRDNVLTLYAFNRNDTKENIIDTEDNKDIDDMEDIFNDDVDLLFDEE